jgi:hypothetical protein
LPNELRISRRERAAPESAEIARISREAVGCMRVFDGLVAVNSNRA